MSSRKGDGMIGRRNFLKRTAAVSAMSCFPATLSGLYREMMPGQIEKRALGKTGENLSMIGFGGIVVKDATTQEAADRVSRAYDLGINYFDVAPTYGNAEDMLGPALEPYRKNAFLACKTQARDKVGVEQELARSLKKLRTDHVDLYQMHAVTKVSDAEQILGPQGALEAFVEAQKSGKVRFIGFSAHSVEAAQKLLAGFDFDTILFPINFATWHKGNFGAQVLEVAQGRGMGILALKAMAKGRLPQQGKRVRSKCWYEPLTDPKEAELGLRFTLSHPVTAAIPPGDEELFEWALKFALRFKPLNAQEESTIKELARTSNPIFEFPSSRA
jgi:predicted aldo/keto reductase-like oxidoreductase